MFFLLGDGSLVKNFAKDGPIYPVIRLGEVDADVDLARIFVSPLGHYLME